MTQTAFNIHPRVEIVLCLKVAEALELITQAGILLIGLRMKKLKIDLSNECPEARCRPKTAINKP